jgi:hypothetical protein
MKPSSHVEDALRAFESEDNDLGKGALGLLLNLTEVAQAKSFPLNPEDFLTPSKGQVAGISGRKASRILKVHGVNVLLASEGGRTSRGNIQRMYRYIHCLNVLHEQGQLDLTEAMAFWVKRVQQYLANAPFDAKLEDRQLSIRAVVNDLLRQAQERQKTRPGSTFSGTMMQHLTAAKLRCLLKDKAPVPHGASEADASRKTAGDFEFQDVVIHVTAAPGSQLIDKCIGNLQAGKRPVVVTLIESIGHAKSLAAQVGVDNRLEFWAFDQFISTNAHEWGGFIERDVRQRTRELITAYNEIIDELNEEPSLRISIA